MTDADLLEAIRQPWAWVRLWGDIRSLCVVAAGDRLPDSEIVSILEKIADEFRKRDEPQTPKGVAHYMRGGK